MVVILKWELFLQLQGRFTTLFQLCKFPAAAERLLGLTLESIGFLDETLSIHWGKDMD